MAPQFPSPPGLHGPHELRQGLLANQPGAGAQGPSPPSPRPSARDTGSSLEASVRDSFPAWESVSHKLLCQQVNKPPPPGQVPPPALPPAGPPSAGPPGPEPEPQSRGPGAGREGLASSTPRTGPVSQEGAAVPAARDPGTEPDGREVRWGQRSKGEACPCISGRSPEGSGPFPSRGL